MPLLPLLHAMAARPAAAASPPTTTTTPQHQPRNAPPRSQTPAATTLSSTAPTPSVVPPPAPPTSPPCCRQQTPPPHGWAPRPGGSRSPPLGVEHVANTKPDNVSSSDERRATHRKHDTLHRMAHETEQLIVVCVHASYQETAQTAPSQPSRSPMLPTGTPHTAGTPRPPGRPQDPACSRPAAVAAPA